ncbi:hypothetical protein AHEV_091 [Adoxophyes honmai entomopoxvirus 'L']|uniref:Uncharacterized protein n=1 Tax=Adoxophyes honmai entomopoxvirus 'L' TaxID=1293540 RepID=A0A916KNY3_9POXV|nr:hypothetical protein AHEV_091 [Adoxophyes honmai entomopoxvirus 'L']CCU55412.1 hypothetical protein AHEV_091 [Adoxophyes honmai entomopoxvirus 'L']
MSDDNTIEIIDFDISEIKNMSYDILIKKSSSIDGEDEKFTILLPSEIVIKCNSHIDSKI